MIHVPISHHSNAHWAVNHNADKNCVLVQIADQWDQVGVQVTKAEAVEFARAILAASGRIGASTKKVEKTS